MAFQLPIRRLAHTARGEDVIITEEALDADLALVFKIRVSRVEIVKAELGPDAVALGGATLPIAQLLSAGAMSSADPDIRSRPRHAVSPG